MRIFFHIISVLGILVFAAHFLRVGNWGATAAILLFLPMLKMRHQWMRAVLQAAFVFAAISWVNITSEMVQVRMAMGAPWARMVVIMGVVIFLCVISALLLNHKKIRSQYSAHNAASRWSTAAFFLTFALLAIVQLKVSRPMLLPERFGPGGGWIAVFVLATYAALLVQKMSDKKAAPLWRKRIWLLFSFVFFGQFVMGVLGANRFLMSGQLHVPVPAVIVAGPLFRGEGFFMPILLAVTLLLVGPAWCSHLCYLGGVDLLAASSKKRPAPHRKWYWTLRIMLLALTISVAIALRLLGVSGITASMVAVGFGIIGLATMVQISRKRGTLFHCAAVCPVGLLAVIAGKLSPFRMKFTNACDGCGGCGLSCRMSALESVHIKNRTVGLNCTLCGDCLSKCNSTGLAYHFGRWHSPRVRMVFLVLTISLHAVFMGVARV